MDSMNFIELVIIISKNSNAKVQKTTELPLLLHCYILCGMPVLLVSEFSSDEIAQKLGKSQRVMNTFFFISKFKIKNNNIEMTVFIELQCTVHAP